MVYPLLWTDGKRNLLKIGRLVRNEGEEEIDLTELVNACEFLEKHKYVEINRRMRKEVAKDEIKEGLQKIGVKKGDVIFVHSSLSKLGYVIGGPNTVIDALIETVGLEGTVVIPTFSFSFPGKNPPFDKKSSSSEVGRITEFFRLRKKTLRSHHPSHSVGAQGKYAEFITKVHKGLPPYDINGPFGKLLKLNAKIIFLACGMGCNSSLHAMEDWANLPYLGPDMVHIINETGETEKLVIQKMPVGHRDFYNEGRIDNPSKITQRLRKLKIIKDGQIGDGEIQLIKIQELKDACFKIFQEEPDILLCDSPSCKFCTESRKKLDYWKRDNTKQLGVT